MRQQSSRTKYGDNRLMQLNHSNHIKLTVPPNLALVTDLDQTLFGPNANETHQQSNLHIHRFNGIWCTQYATNNSVLIYATGRNFENYQLAVKQWDILIPDILVNQDGAAIHWFNKYLYQQVHGDTTAGDDDSVRLDTSWSALVQQGWNQTVAHQIYDEVCNKYDLILELPKGCCSTELFRICVLSLGPRLAKEIEQYFIQRVNEYNEENKDRDGFIPMVIHSFICLERTMDRHNNNAYWSVFTPEKAGKGEAIQFLRRKLHLKEKDIICCGDSGNDISMLSIDGINSVIVANASQELLDFYGSRKEMGNEHIPMIKTKKSKTLGVIEGLLHYGPSLLKR